MIRIFLKREEGDYLCVKNQAIGKSIWRMPRQLEAKKDVIHCEKSWGVVNKHRSANIRMGKPTEQSVLYDE